jgi:hypothetical protein
MGWRYEGIHGPETARTRGSCIVAGPNVNIKPGGMAEINGTLYVGVTCITYGQDSTLFVRQHDLAGFIAASTDNGTSWSNVTAVGSFPGRFAAPTFTNCGPGQPCRDPDANLNWT